MPKHHNLLIMLIYLTITFFSFGKLASASLTAIESSKEALALINSGCSIKPEKSQEIYRLKSRIASADNINAARMLALKPTDDALSALDKAKLFAPFSNDIAVAHDRLSDARERLLNAMSQKQVADEFEGIMVAGLDDDRMANVKVGGGSCSYSSGELIAIVVGLILGIIPGIILLVVLC